jgi:hypothetical protein
VADELDEKVVVSKLEITTPYAAIASAAALANTHPATHLHRTAASGLAEILEKITLNMRM